MSLWKWSDVITMHNYGGHQIDWNIDVTNFFSIRAREMPRSMRATIRFRKLKITPRARPVAVTVEHKYDGLGRLVRTDRTVTGPTTTVYEHVRNGLKLVGNIDATSANTAPTWTNSPRGLRPVESQQIQTNSATQFINVADESVRAAGGLLTP